MITIPIHKGQIEAAKKLYKFRDLDNSITRGKHQWVGALGEIVLSDYFKQFWKVDMSSTYDYDIIVNGKKVEVKTKLCTSPPQPHYHCDVAATNTKQKCDYYFFVRVNTKDKEAYIMGYIDRWNFYKKARLHKKGSPDGNTGYNFKADTYSVYMSDLKDNFKVK